MRQSAVRQSDLPGRGCPPEPGRSRRRGAATTAAPSAHRSTRRVPSVSLLAVADPLSYACGRVQRTRGQTSLVRHVRCVGIGSFGPAAVLGGLASGYDRVGGFSEESIGCGSGSHRPPAAGRRNRRMPLSGQLRPEGRPRAAREAPSRPRGAGCGPSRRRWRQPPHRFDGASIPSQRQAAIDAPDTVATRSRQAGSGRGPKGGLRRHLVRYHGVTGSRRAHVVWRSVVHP